MGKNPSGHTLFDGLSDDWWSENGYLSMLKWFVNPWRLPYFRAVIARNGIDPRNANVLDVGCGGGLLAEEIASMGFTVAGIDQSERSIDAACVHSEQSGLAIDYRTGSAEELPFEDGSFTIVTCCDVLEHVRRWPLVLREIGRVLKRGGIVFYDTINRTAMSGLIFIKIAQEWRFTRITPGSLHAWDMFIKPGELLRSLNEQGFDNKDLVGGRLCGNMIEALRNVRRFKRGRITAAELGRRLRLKKTRKLWLCYAGYAVRR
ncbi:MAG: bifunctional 2-polyprenyl-6-hydroxyphenol methylase/3-demethylubiquinol 3-O-methyltransferase UbiG [Thermodesulfobacteriota bacterium]